MLRSTLLLAFCLASGSVLAHKGHRHHRDFPSDEPHEVSWTHLHLRTNVNETNPICSIFSSTDDLPDVDDETSLARCGADGFRLPKEISKSSLLIAAAAENNDALVCISVVAGRHHKHHHRHHNAHHSHHRHHKGHLAILSTTCGVGQVKVCVQESNRLKKHGGVLVSLAETETITQDERELTKAVYQIGYDVIEGDCNPVPCENKPEFEELCNAINTTETCFEEKSIRKACKGTCSSLGVTYRHCGTPTPDATLTPCQARQHAASGLIGEYVPQCEEDGSFSRVQCHGSTGHCWCVNVFGEMLVGTDVAPGEEEPVCGVEPESESETETETQTETQTESESDLGSEHDHPHPHPGRPDDSVVSASTHGHSGNSNTVMTGAVMVAGFVCVVVGLALKRRSKPSLSSQDAAAVTV